MALTARRLFRGRDGFTLLEILVVLALIGLLTSVLVVGINRLLRERPKTPDELFWAMVADTRKEALFNNVDVQLSFDGKTQEFVTLPLGLPPVVPTDPSAAGAAGSGDAGVLSSQYGSAGSGSTSASSVSRSSSFASGPYGSANSSSSSSSASGGLQAPGVRHPFVPKEVAEIDFLAAKSSGVTASSMLVGGQLVETQTIPFVTFYRDGTCSPFRLQIKTRNGARVLEIDPWTCAQMLNPDAPR